MKISLNAIVILAFILACGCTSETKTKKQDQSEQIKSIEQIAEQYLEAWNNKNINKFDQLTTEDGQYYGSDPEEIMDKAALLQMYSQFFADTTTSYQYTVNLRKIKISTSGKSAVIMERITFPEWSPKMPMCQTIHLELKDKQWKIDFICWGFIIKNDDVTKVNEVL